MAPSRSGAEGPPVPASAGKAPVRYAVFLRGVNVGGVTVRMAELRALLADLPVRDVATVLASGNVVCSSALDAPELRSRVEEALTTRFGYPARVIVVDHAGLAAIAASVAAPDDAVADAQADHAYVTFFTGADELAAFLEEARGLHSTVLAGGAAIGWFAPKGQSTDVPLARLLARPRYAATSTTRNINTVDRVLRLLG